MYLHLNEQIASQHQTEMRDQATRRASHLRARRGRQASTTAAGRTASLRPRPAPAR